MRTRRAQPLVLFALSSLLLMGCPGDDGSEDAGADTAPADTASGQDTSPDTRATDTAEDVTADTAEPDTHHDSGADTDTSGKDTAPEDTGGDTEPTDGGGDAGQAAIALEDIPERTADRVCSQYFQCCSADERSALGSGLGPNNFLKSKKKCREFYSNYVESTLVGAFRDAIDDGRVTFDGAAYARCLRNYDCQRLSTQDTLGCQSAVVGQVPLGGSCKSDIDCKKGACAKASGAKQGTCKTRPGKGDSCSNLACQSGYFCESGTCVETKPNGQSCQTDGNCKSDFCYENDQGMAVCSDKLAGGENCMYGYECQSGICRKKGSNSQETCYPAPLCDGT